MQYVEHLDGLLSSRLMAMDGYGGVNDFLHLLAYDFCRRVMTERSASPQMTILELRPRRVSMVFIWETVTFWNSSQTMNELASVEPRMYASGHTCTRS